MCFLRLIALCMISAYMVGESAGADDLVPFQLRPRAVDGTSRVDLSGLHDRPAGREGFLTIAAIGGADQLEKHLVFRN